MVQNDELAKLFNKNSNYISGLITSLEKQNYIRVENKQSRYRKIYLQENLKVKDNLLSGKSGFTLRKTCNISKRSEITKKTKANGEGKFKTFWQMFRELSPSPVGSKENAKTQWLRIIKKTLAEKVLEGLQNFSTDYQRKMTAGKFAPNWKHCERWLKSGDWQIEIEPLKRGEYGWLPDEQELGKILEGTSLT